MSNLFDHFFISPNLAPSDLCAPPPFPLPTSSSSPSFVSFFCTALDLVVFLFVYFGSIRYSAEPKVAVHVQLAETWQNINRFRGRWLVVQARLSSVDCILVLVNKSRFIFRIFFFFSLRSFRSFGFYSFSSGAISGWSWWCLPPSWTDIYYSCQMCWNASPLPIDRCTANERTHTLTRRLWNSVYLLSS